VTAVAPEIVRELPLSASQEANSRALLEGLTALGVAAAVEVLRYGVADVRTKPNGSPVTVADEAAEAVIRAGLERLAPGIPVVSEEQERRPAAAGASLFLVDPLDGTRDFVAGRDEYAINIALMRDGQPAAGVIVAPARGLVWRGIVGAGAERLEFDRGGALSPPAPIRTRRYAADDFVVMVSRSHLDARTEAYLAGLPPIRRLERCGSAIKFCRIAEGSADHYPRLGPTHDWDVAAGHAIVEAAGGRLTAPDGGAIRYGTADLLIPGFLAWGDPAAAAALGPNAGPKLGL